MKAVLLIWTVNGFGGWDLEQVPMSTYEACDFAQTLVEIATNVHTVCVPTE